MTPEPLTSASANDRAALSGLCLRSKGHWGYDADFLNACRAELTVTPNDLASDAAAVMRRNGRFVGYVQVSVEGKMAELERLFVDPGDIGHGHGRVLFAWAVSAARDLGATQLKIVADPDACAFYKAMGAMQNGTEPSASIPGRSLPRLFLPL